jgi:hypothetical protein
MKIIDFLDSKLDKDTLDVEFLNLDKNPIEIKAADYDHADVVDIQYVKIARITIKRN